MWMVIAWLLSMYWAIGMCKIIEKTSGLKRGVIDWLLMCVVAWFWVFFDKRQ